MQAQAEQLPSRQEYGAATPWDSRKSSSGVPGAHPSKANSSPSRSPLTRAGASRSGVVGLLGAGVADVDRPDADGGVAEGVAAQRDELLLVAALAGEAELLEHRHHAAHERAGPAHERVVAAEVLRHRAQAVGGRQPLQALEPVHQHEAVDVLLGELGQLARRRSPTTRRGWRRRARCGRCRGSSAVFTIDITGVMPLPPANSSRSASRSAGVKIPLGGSTVSVVPGTTLSQIQFDA